jgi:hypothetical protein
MTWFVHRNGGSGTPISSASRNLMVGYNDEALADDDSEIVAYLAAAQAPPYVPPTPRQWLERLSPTTQLSLETAALTNAQVSLWLRKATGNPSIDVTLPETATGVAAMVSAGLLSTDEQSVLLTP